MAKPTYEQLRKRVRELEKDKAALEGAVKSLRENEKRTSHIIPAKTDFDTLKLSHVIDAKAIQSMMDDFHALTNIGIGILDTEGNILVSTGWQDICTQFHRKHPETLSNCRKSDLELASGVEPGSFRLYKCRNNMWDMATPIVVDGERLGTLYLGQFFFEDESPDLDRFRLQAQEYGFDEKSYLEAFERVPRWKRETVDIAMSFYAKLANLISELSYGNIHLARTLNERRLMERELATARRLESMGILADGLAHDYNNLLSMILGNIAMAKEEMAPGKSTSGFLDDAEEATLKAKDLTHRLMTLSQKSGSHKRLRSVKDVLEICAAEFSTIPNYVFNVNMAGDLWPAEHDSVQLKYAIRNVLKNSIEAMPEGGVLSLEAENVFVTENQGDPNLPDHPGAYLKISIRDQGEGIFKRDLEKIFDPYFSTKETGSERGMGLGLAITHSIIDKHDGYVAVQSNRGKGTTVQIYLPAKPTGNLNKAGDHWTSEKERKREKTFTASEKRPKAAGRTTGKRILVMDDEELLRQLVFNMLKRLGHDAVTVTNGDEAVSAYDRAMKENAPFDAVILDLTVKKGMGGRETIKALRRMDPRVKAIVSSGYFNDPVLTSYKDYGFCEAIPKPYQKNDLQQVLKRVFNA